MSTVKGEHETTAPMSIVKDRSETPTVASGTTTVNDEHLTSAPMSTAKDVSETTPLPTDATSKHDEHPTTAPMSTVEVEHPTTAQMSTNRDKPETTRVTTEATTEHGASETILVTTEATTKYDRSEATVVTTEPTTKHDERPTTTPTTAPMSTLRDEHPTTTPMSTFKYTSRTTAVASEATTKHAEHTTSTPISTVTYKSQTTLMTAETTTKHDQSSTMERVTNTDAVMPPVPKVTIPLSVVIPTVFLVILVVSVFACYRNRRRNTPGSSIKSDTENANVSDVYDDISEPESAAQSVTDVIADFTSFNNNNGPDPNDNVNHCTTSNNCTQTDDGGRQRPAEDTPLTDISVCMTTVDSCTQTDIGGLLDVVYITDNGVYLTLEDGSQRDYGIYLTTSDTYKLVNGRETGVCVTSFMKYNDRDSHNNLTLSANQPNDVTDYENLRPLRTCEQLSGVALLRLPYAGRSDIGLSVPLSNHFRHPSLMPTMTEFAEKGPETEDGVSTTMGAITVADLHR